MNRRRSGGDCLTIGALARRTGVNIETIRYYERIRLLPHPARTEGGHRVFSSEDLRALSFVKRSRELGFSLDSIRALLSLRGPDRCCRDAKTIAVQHLQNVQTKIRDLVALEEILTRTIQQCSGEQTADCAVLDLLDIGHTEAPRPSL